MVTYTEKELLFSFPKELVWEELDCQGVKIPHGMMLVDLVINRDDDLLLVEIKDPSHTKCPEQGRNQYFRRLENNTILTEELTPKIRDSYTFIHLMNRDSKPIIYVVLLGLEAFDNIRQLALLSNFKDRLIADLRNEGVKPWVRNHIHDCVVLTVDKWNENFPQWPVRRISENIPNSGDAG